MSFFSFFKKKDKPQLIQPNKAEKADLANKNAKDKELIITGIILSHSQTSGKTSVLRALSGMPFVNDTGATIIDFSIIKIAKQNINIKLQIWDTSSHPSYQPTVNTYIKTLQKQKNKTVIILVIPEFDSEFEQFKDYLLKNYEALSKSLFIVCQTRVKWKIKGNTEVNRFIKSIFQQEMKFFKVFPQTGQGIQEMKHFIADYFLDQRLNNQTKPFRLKDSKTFEYNLKKLNVEYFNQFVVSIAKKDAKTIQEQLETYKKINNIYRQELIKHGINPKQILEINNINIEQEFENQQQIQLQKRQENLPQVRVIKKVEVEADVEVDQLKRSQRDDDAKSISFSQIQYEFYQKIKGQKINMDELRNQLSGIYSQIDYNKKSELQKNQ